MVVAPAGGGKGSSLSFSLSRFPTAPLVPVSLVCAPLGGAGGCPVPSPMAVHPNPSTHARLVHPRPDILAQTSRQPASNQPARRQAGEQYPQHSGLLAWLTTQQLRSAWLWSGSGRAQERARQKTESPSFAVQLHETDNPGCQCHDWPRTARC